MGVEGYERVCVGRLSVGDVLISGLVVVEVSPSARVGMVGLVLCGRFGSEDREVSVRSYAWGWEETCLRRTSSGAPTDLAAIRDRVLSGGEVSADELALMMTTPPARAFRWCVAVDGVFQVRPDDATRDDFSLAEASNLACNIREVYGDETPVCAHPYAAPRVLAPGESVESERGYVARSYATDHSYYAESDKGSLSPRFETFEEAGCWLNARRVRVSRDGEVVVAVVRESFRRDGVEWLSLSTDDGEEFNMPAIYCQEA
jgi:hypothetical protein